MPPGMMAGSEKREMERHGVARTNGEDRNGPTGGLRRRQPGFARMGGVRLARGAGAPPKRLERQVLSPELRLSRAVGIYPRSVASFGTSLAIDTAVAPSASMRALSSALARFFCEARRTTSIKLA